MPSVTSEATCAASVAPPAQLNTATGRVPYVIGTDPELDAFLARTLSKQKPQELQLAVHCSSWLLRTQPLRPFELLVRHLQALAVC